MDGVKDDRITAREFGSLMKPMADDLTDGFRAIMAEIERVFVIAERDGWTPEQLLKEVDDVFAEDSDDGQAMGQA